MDFSEYEVFDPGPGGLLGERTRPQARGHYEKLMAEKEQRKQELAHLLGKDGVALEPSDEGLQRLNDWFLARVEADPDEPGRLVKEWYSVVNDIALFLGDVMIERAPTLTWTLFLGHRKDTSYQRHVIVGFDVPNPKYNVDADLVVANYAHDYIRGDILSVDQFGRGLFVRMVHTTTKKAKT